MSYEFLNLKDHPFRITPDSYYFYSSEAHSEAVEIIRYSVETRKGFIVLLGEVGTGKTTICRVLLNNLLNTETSLILNPLMSPDDIILQIVEDFKIPYESGDNTGKLYNRLADFLISNFKKGKNALIIVDEAQNLSFESFEMIRQISNIEMEDAKLVQILLVGQPELKLKLSENRLRQLDQRISVRVNLSPLSYEDTEHYIEYRVDQASIFKKRIFNKNAIKKIYHFTKGNPRQINQICDNAVVVAAAKNKKKIDNHDIEEAYKLYRGVDAKYSIKYVLAGVFVMFIVTVMSFIFRDKIFAEKQGHDKGAFVQTAGEMIPDNISYNTQNSISGNITVEEKLQCVKTLRRLNLRSEPVIDNNVIKVLNENMLCVIRLRGEDWINVDCGGVLGWVSGKSNFVGILNCE
mgnify:CR=1 FL=1